MKWLLLLPPLAFALHALAQPRRDLSILTNLSRFPDNPSVRLLTLYIQLPLARWPTVRRNPFTRSRGLVFMELYAVRGDVSASQFFAFRPQSRILSYLANRPAAGVFTDESSQHYHASLRIPLTELQWTEILKDLYRWARFVPYRRDSCNDATFASQLLQNIHLELIGLYPPDCHHPGDLYRWLQTLHVDVDRGQLYTDRKRRYAGVSYETTSLLHSNLR